MDAWKQQTILRLLVTHANSGGIRGQLEGIAGVEAFLPFSKMPFGSASEPAGRGTVLQVKIVAVRLQQ